MGAAIPVTTQLQVRRLGVDTYQESVVYLNRECSVCKSIGFESLSRIRICLGERSIVATLNVVTGTWLDPFTAGLSEAAWRRLGAHDGDRVTFEYPQPAESASDLRSKVFGHALDRGQYERLLRDAIDGRLSDIELAAFIAACAGPAFDLEENIALTEAMVDVGERIEWPRSPVLDKHSVGGLPGNRTTPIVVSIVAAAGLLIPKTSSRAITSPAGTADAMETLTRVDLDLPAMRRVVEREGGCIVWGGAMSPQSGRRPADSGGTRPRPRQRRAVGRLRAVEEGRGRLHPCRHRHPGRTDREGAQSRRRCGARQAARRCRWRNRPSHCRACLPTDVSPIGRGIGPALEAWDVLRVLRNADDAPADLQERALELAAKVLDFDSTTPGRNRSSAEYLLRSGAALRKFEAICLAQGGMHEPPVAAYRFEFLATRDGIVEEIDNRKLAKVAKLAGAPRDAAAGLVLNTPLGARVNVGEPLLTLHAESAGELDYARAYLDQHAALLRIGEGS